jgi:hypothetical protein
MSNKNLKLFEQLIRDSKNSDILHLEETVHHIIRIFMKLKEQLESNNPEIRKAAAEDLKTLQVTLQKEADKAAKETGLSPDELKEYMQTKQNFSDQEWDAIKRAEKELTEYESELKKTPIETKKPPSKKSNKKPPPKSKWISS